jgi:selenocysteine-specific elongation factor
MIVGTAGHIDHGKTSLVRALTGIDTDRLKEEKARGITIELGFAYLPRPGRETIGFVDVPGHERLVHTMLAGATGIDLVLLVVAADDGVMPQTREHLAIVDLLGIQRGLVALTKCDLAGPGRRAEVSADIDRLLAPTRLAGAEVIPVSSVTGDGIGTLQRRLDELGAATGSRATDGRFRLAIDRSFSLAGAGTVATGTVLSGRVKVGDSVLVSPSGLEARVRSLHAQSKASDTGVAGQRCALALVGPKIDAASVHRGDVVLDPTLHQPVKRLDVRLTLLASERKGLVQWLPVKLHHGSAERDARVLVLNDRGLAPGATDYAQLVLDEPLAAAAHDRFILRDTSASRTIGGGIILDLHPPERQRSTPGRRAELAAITDPDAMTSLAARLQSERGFVDVAAHFRDRAGNAGLADEAVRTLSLVTFPAGNSFVGMLPDMWRRYTANAIALLDAFHKEKPDQPGLGQERLRLMLPPRLPAPCFVEAVRRLGAEGSVVLDRSWVRRPAHEVRFSDEEERILAKARALLGGAERFRPPRVRDISKLHRIDESKLRRVLKMAARRGEVDEIAQDHFFLSGTVIEMADIARALAEKGENGQFAVVDFRDRLDNGRKVAIQILEFFDRQGLTMRRGDVRRINPHKRDLYSRAAQSGKV